MEFCEPVTRSGALGACFAPILTRRRTKKQTTIPEIKQDSKPAISMMFPGPLLESRVPNDCPIWIGSQCFAGTPLRLPDQKCTLLPVSDLAAPGSVFLKVCIFAHLSVSVACTLYSQYRVVLLWWCSASLSQRSCATFSPPSIPFR